MKLKLVFLILILLQLSVLAQSDTVVMYTDLKMKSVAASEAKLIFKVFQNNSSTWTMSVYDAKNVIQQKETYGDSLLTIRHGSYIEYEKGKVALHGQYLKNIREGTFTFYDSVGVVTQTITYLNGKPIGAKKTYWSNGNVKQLTVFKDNRVGEKAEFYENGALCYRETYNFRGTIVESVVLDQAGNKMTKEWLVSDPKFPGGIEKFFKIIDRNLIFPDEPFNKGIQGVVDVSFTITETGEITDVKVGKPRDPSLDEEAIRVVKLAGNWIPAVRYGNPLSVTFKVAIEFKMGETRRP